MQASMHYSCAMIALRVTPLADEEGANVEGAEEVEGDVVSVRGCLGLSCAALRLTVAASMALIIGK